MVKIKLDTKHEEYRKNKVEIDRLLTAKNISYCQILGVDSWKSSIFSAKELDDLSLVKLIGQMESVKEISFEKE